MKIMSKSTLKILTALMIAITAALLTQPMRASAIQTLVITENSSTSLTATLTTSSGTTSLNVTSNGADRWFIDLANVGVGGSHQSWTEPDAAGFVNLVETDLVDSNILDVTSDFGPGHTGLADDTTDFTSFTLGGGPLSVTFDDDGDVAAVPDTGTTCSLFGLSLMGLGFLRRKLC
jgi:VPDSG-CTERM motif